MERVAWTNTGRKPKKLAKMAAFEAFFSAQLFMCEIIQSD